MGLDSKEVDPGLPVAQLSALRVLPAARAAGEQEQEPEPGSVRSREGQGDQLERIWDTQWQGEPTSVEVQDAPQTAGSPGGEQKAANEGKGSAVPQFLRNLKELGNRLRTLGKRRHSFHDMPDVQERLDSTMAFRVPRYPSWVEFD